MPETRPIELEERPALPGDLMGLAHRLGSPHPAVRGPVLAGLADAGVVDAVSLGGFLNAYGAEVLGPVELRAVQKAYAHAARGALRELLALDAALGRELRLGRFAAASQAVGRSQLWRLLPLRDVRLVRRYWAAVEAGEAGGWHPLVYGVFLSIFSIPVRQGLLHYGNQILGGFIESACAALTLSPDERSGLEREAGAALPALVERNLVVESSCGLVCVPTPPRF